MRKRPVSITAIGWLFVATGSIGFVVAAMRRFAPGAFGPEAGPGAHPDADFAFAATSGLLAATGGILAFRGSRWAPWLLLAWMGAHVVIGLLHSTEQLIVHGVFFAALLFLLLRPSASAFFRRARAGES